MISRRKPIPMCGSPTRRLHLTWLPFMAQRAKSRSQAPCYWYVPRNLNLSKLNPLIYPLIGPMCLSKQTWPFPRTLISLRLCNTSDFINLVERVKRELQVSIIPNFKQTLPANGASGTETPIDYSFKFRCQRSNTDFLITAREMLEQFLQKIGSSRLPFSDVTGSQARRLLR